MRMSDWSSDVCSSDLRIERGIAFEQTAIAVALEERRQALAMAEVDGGEAAVEALAGTDRRLELPAIVVRAVGLIARPAGDQAGVVAARVADLRGDAVADRLALPRQGRYLAARVVGP